jgi:hypothetical protein
VNYDFYFFRGFFIHALLQASRSCDGNRTAGKLLVEGGAVEPALLPETFVYEQPKRQQTTPQSSVKNWLRIRAMLNICTRRRARRLLWRASWFLLVGGVAYLVFFALVNDGRPVDQSRTIPTHQQQATIPAAQPADPSHPTA